MSSEATLQSNRQWNRRWNRQGGVVVSGGTGALGGGVVARFLTSGAPVTVPWIVKAEAEALGRVHTEAVAAGRLRLVEADVSEESGAAASVLTMRVEDPSGSGRIVRDADGLVADIVEQPDLAEDQLGIDEVNTSTYCFDADALLSRIEQLSADNSNDILSGAFPGGRAHGGYKDTLTVSSPGLDGQPGFFVFTVNVSGTLSATGDILCPQRHAIEAYCSRGHARTIKSILEEYEKLSKLTDDAVTWRIIPSATEPFTIFFGARDMRLVELPGFIGGVEYHPIRVMRQFGFQ